MELGEEIERVHVKPKAIPYEGEEVVEDRPDWDAPAEKEKEEKELEKVGVPNE